MPGRKFNTPTYRYGFNGKEKEDEIANTDGADLDFGARIYDARLGRFMGLDPNQESYPWLSPFSFAGNNSILIVDPDGRDNIIYLLVLPGSESKLSKTEINDIISQTNQSFKDMGLKTEVRLANTTKFDISKIDNTDAVAVVGVNKKAISDFVSKKLDSKFGEVLEKEFKGSGAENPEFSENEDYNKTWGENNIIALDFSDLEGTARNLELRDEDDYKVKAAALTILHGAGHNAKQNHYNDCSQCTNTQSVIMRKGNDLALVLRKESGYGTYKEITNNKPSEFSKNLNRNMDYVASMRARFGTNTPSGNNKSGGGKTRYSPRFK